MARVHQRPLITKVLQLYGPPESIFQTVPPLGKDPETHDPPTIERPSCGRDDTFQRKLMPDRKRRMQAMYAICRFHVAVCTAERTNYQPSFHSIGAKQLHPHRPPSSGPLRIKVGFLQRNPTLMRRGWQFGTPRAKRGPERFQPHSRTPFDRHEKSGATRFG